MGIRLAGLLGLRRAGFDAIEILDEGVTLGDDKVRLNFLGAGVTVTVNPADPAQVDVDVSAGVVGGAAPAQIDAGDAAVIGVAATASHSDHQHPVNTGLAINIQPTGLAAGAGVSLALPRADHVHRLEVNVQDEDVPVGSRPTLNFTGNVVAVDDPANDEIDIAIAPDGSMAVFGANNVSTTVTIRYLWPTYEETLALIIPYQLRMPRAGTLRNMRVRHNIVGVGAVAITYTVRVNNVATALAVAMLATAADGSNIVASIAVAAGDLVDVQVTKAGALGASPIGIVATMEYV